MAKTTLRVVVIGAGMSGILAAIKLQQAGYTDVIVYEKADRIGGTWRENTYPGLTCDVPSHHYTYSFERNPDWTRHLPPGGEIQAYFERVTDSYHVRESIRFNTEVVAASYRDQRWHLELADGSRDSADVVIAATGVLHHPSWPEIPGMDTFRGALFHSARWDHSVPLAGKRVGIVGMGSTGVQIVSELSAAGVAVSHFVRTPQWIMPVENGYFPEQERAAFRADPELLNRTMDFEGYAASVDAYTQALTNPDSEVAIAMSTACRENLQQGVHDATLREQLTPDHEPFCKRLIFSPDYYQAIQRPNAHLVRSDIRCIEPGGIRTGDGCLHELDVIALATGFRADQFMRPMRIHGRDGLDLETLWAKRPVAYLAVAMPDFPNFFMLNGPNGPVGNFSLIEIAEIQWRYIEQLLERLRSGEYRAISPTRDAMEAFDSERVAAAKKTIWYTGGCQSWYLDAEGIPASWPWSFSKFVSMMREPEWRHYQLTTE
ncbi:NAD(P)/FAD-dependent oxidoreductase [Pseudohalioglobus sediminis]|uniref:NAD(P)/FAD-dependent oxidoreductase n=1 Tax=Pseudohalioglobus sediminis TaxID=2606449 RepID=A0A5B0X4F4_9GAMM|nr:NAD(P)/FAD-dependent oxidoreductase [Pseudohalioglobus sediminis]KAA1194250.1 NAD(P)/FAD-dependent oxidoreductase [Pseudohalioglobus sediminis]